MEPTFKLLLIYAERAHVQTSLGEKFPTFNIFSREPTFLAKKAIFSFFRARGPHFFNDRRGFYTPSPARASGVTTDSVQPFPSAHNRGFFPHFGRHLGETPFLLSKRDLSIARWSRALQTAPGLK